VIRQFLHHAIRRLEYVLHRHTCSSRVLETSFLARMGRITCMSAVGVVRGAFKGASRLREGRVPLRDTGARTSVGTGGPAVARCAGAPPGQRL
jgi:hypothetical protein